MKRIACFLLAVVLLALTACASRNEKGVTGKMFSESLKSEEHNEGNTQKEDSHVEKNETETEIVTEPATEQPPVELTEPTEANDPTIPQATADTGVIYFDTETMTETPEPLESDFDDPLYPIPSQDTFDQIAKDWMEQEKDDNRKSCRVSEYYGKYGDTFVVKFENEYFNYDFGIIDDTIHIYFDGGRIDDRFGEHAFRVWKDGRLYQLVHAYENGFLTDEDMRNLSVIIDEGKAICFINP